MHQTSHPDAGRDSPHEILIVEDDDTHYELMMASIEASDLELATFRVATGEEAIEALRDRARNAPAEQFRCVMLDLHLPGMSGHDVLREIRLDAELRHLPVVILSTSIGETDRLQAYELGANSYVKKPMDFAQFQVAVQSVYRYWSVHNLPSLAV